MTTAVTEPPKTRRFPAKFDTVRTHSIPNAPDETISRLLEPSPSDEVILTTEVSSTATNRLSVLTERNQYFTSASTLAHSNPFLSGKLNQALYPEALWPQYTLSTGPAIYGSAFLPPAPMQYSVSAINLEIHHLRFTPEVLIVDLAGAVSAFKIARPIELANPFDTKRSRQIDLELSGLMELIFSRGREERFEDGMESEFARSLAAVIQKYNVLALVQIAKMVREATRSHFKT